MLLWTKSTTTTMRRKMCWRSICSTTTATASGAIIRTRPTTDISSSTSSLARYRYLSSNRPDFSESDMMELLLADTGTGNGSTIGKKHPHRRRSRKDPKRTALYDFHKDIGCTFTVYDGYEVPLYYHHSQGGIIKEHEWCRTPNCASIFDISYLTQFRIFGKDRIHFMERCTTADLQQLPMDQATFTCVTNEPQQHVSQLDSADTTGTTITTTTNNNTKNYNPQAQEESPNNLDIIDMGMISKCDDNLYLVVNGDPIIKSRLWEHFQTYLTLAAEMNINTDLQIDTTIDERAYEYMVYMYTLEKSHALLSIQGSGAAAALQPLLPSHVQLDQLSHCEGIRTSIYDIESCRITRCGFTGMDGFELSIPHAAAEEIVVHILESNPTTVNVAGLGARNTLRVESGLLQYGIDINPYENTMIETGYIQRPNSIIHPRRQSPDGATFLGVEHILGQIHAPTTTTTNKMNTALNNPPRPVSDYVVPKYSKLRHVGMIGMDRIVTANAIIYDGTTGTIPIGHVTSGIYSPTLKKHIAMGYVLEEYMNIDTPIQLEMIYDNGRSRKRMNATITTMPFVPTQYYRYIGPRRNVSTQQDNSASYNDDDDNDQEPPQAQYDSITANIRPDQVERYNQFPGQDGQEYDDDDDGTQDLLDIYTKDNDEFLQYSNYYTDSEMEDNNDEYEDDTNIDDDNNKRRR